MNFFKRLTVLFFVTLNLFIASTIALYVANVLQYENVSNLVYLSYYDDNVRIAFGALAGIIVVMNFVFYKLFTINVHRDKTIAFDNPEGRVSVSLAALEDLVKRTIHDVDEVKDSKTKIVASKKGLHISMRLAIRSDVSIPAMISQVQDLIKDKIQDTIGLDEKVDITVYVGKIVPDIKTEVKKKKKKSDDNAESKPEDGGEPTVPFHGYRA